MKRAMYLLLVVWIALQSALVQAHMVKESLHQIDHTVQLSHHSMPDADHDGACTVAACCHPVGAFYMSAKLSWDPLTCLPPTTVLPLQSAHAPDDIERPKWPTTTPGVAGI
jgi:hypothetical protein